MAVKVATQLSILKIYYSYYLSPFKVFEYTNTYKTILQINFLNIFNVKGFIWLKNNYKYFLKKLFIKRDIKYV